MKKNDFKKPLKKEILTAENVFRLTRSSENGLTSEEAERNRALFGANRNENKKKESVFMLLLKDMFSSFNLVLLVLAFVSLLADVILSNGEKKDFSTFIVLLVMVVLSGTLHSTIDFKSRKKTDALLKEVITTATVIRDGKACEIPFSEVTVGDLVLLHTGDMVPGDSYLLSAKDLYVNQSSLTGESAPVRKERDDNQNKESLSSPQYLYKGTNITSGQGKAIILRVGKKTMIGRISSDLSRKEKTQFDKDLAKISKLLFFLMMIMVPTIFLIDFATKHQGLEALLYSLSIAVGLTPEMLPLIVTSTLAKGSLLLGKKDVIVKNLSAIESLGSMDVLCSDKTGTLTEDKLVYHTGIDEAGKRSNKPLFYASLNSFSLSFPNALDEGIREARKENQSLEGFTKVHEFPFDFERRIASVLFKEKDGYLLVSKGASKEILKRTNLSFKEQERILSLAFKEEKKGYKALAIAIRRSAKPFTEAMDAEKDLTFIGFVLFATKIKESAMKNILALKRLGIEVKVLTGDNEATSENVATRLHLLKGRIITGEELDMATREEKEEMVRENTVFARLTPENKREIVSILRELGHHVGFMGDGINDAPALKEADVAISVNNAVDLAKECADIVLLKKDLGVLKEGVIEGRNTLLNMEKYIRITLASNFGNVFSVLFAAWMLPFLPLEPIQMLLLNLFYDFACLAIPFDHNSKESLKEPSTLSPKALLKTMLLFGPLSSVFDILTYLFSYLILCPSVFHNSYGALTPDQEPAFVSLFQTAWFVESLWSQSLAIFLLRKRSSDTEKNHPSLALVIAQFSEVSLLTLLPFTPLGKIFSLSRLPASYLLYLLFALTGYMLSISLVRAMSQEKKRRKLDSLPLMRLS